jgi:hypothetical protein
VPDPDVLLRLRALKDDRVPAWSPDRRLQWLLRRLKREFRFCCVEVRDAMPHDDAKFRAALEALKGCPPPGSLWRHRATGAVVRVLEGSLWEETLVPAVTYRHVHDGPPWARLLPAFLERFERLPEGEA